MRTDLNEQIRELIDGGARPVSSTEIKGLQPVRRPRPARVPAGPPGRRAAAAAGIAAAGIAAAVTVALIGGGAGQEHPGQAAAVPADPVLTAAMVRQVAAASGTALAHSGHIRITYSDVSSLDPGDGGAGTDDITFSGSDWDYAIDQTAPPNGMSVNRFVGGRLYYYGQGFVRHPGDPLSWFSALAWLAQPQNAVFDPGVPSCPQS